MEIEELRRIAAKEEISFNYTAKDEMLSKILLQLKGNDNIILKGGTAINRVYLKNKRFSEDIDFDLVYKGTVKQALSRTREIINKIEGFTVARPRIMKGTIRYDLYYNNPLNHKDKIRLEFKVIKKASDYSKKIVNFGFVPYESTLLNVYDLKKMIWNKIDCILNRMEGKDFFDLYHLLDLPHEPLQMSRKEKDSIIKRISLEEKEIRSIVNIVNHYIPRSKRPSWGIFLEELKKKINKN